jgi:hypothetical protein
MNRSWKEYYWNKEKRCFTNGKIRIIGANNWFNQYKPAFSDQVAINVAEKTGRSVEEIKKEWDDKRLFSIERGNNCHDYIRAYLRGSSYWENTHLPNYIEHIQVVLNKLKKEGWIPFLVEDNISAYGLLGKPDVVLYNPEINHYKIIDWKFVDKFKISNSHQSLLGPFKKWDNCHFVNYSAIGELYSLVLAKEFRIPLNKISSVLINFSSSKKGITIKEYSLNKTQQKSMRTTLLEELKKFTPDSL